MKKIYSILLTASAFLAFSPFASAQTIADVCGNLSFPQEKAAKVEGGVGVNKTVSSPTSNGTYWIKLEAFSTGSAQQIVSSTPSDIILILDSSTSMRENDYGGTATYTALNNGNPQGYSYQSYGNNTYYYYYEGEYYPVSRGGNGQGQVRYLTFTDKNRTVYYLNNYRSGSRLNNTQYTDDNSPSTVLSATGPDTNNPGIWRGVLYQKNVTGQITRLSALQTATNEFIENIWQNDHDVSAVDASYPGNRIAIVTYDENAHLLTSDWVDIGADGARSTLESAVNRISLNNWTRPGEGMASAIDNFLDGSPSSKREGANLTVVLFTDGLPAHSQGTGNIFEDVDANEAIIQAYTLKKTYGATLFTVGLIDPYSNTEDLRKGRYFLDLLSSNYPDALVTNNSSWTTNADGTLTVSNLTTGTPDEEGGYYQLVDDNTDLSSIFDAISKQSGGSADGSLSSATTVVDIVSSSFMLPDNASTTDIKLFTAKCTNAEEGTDGTWTYEFGTEKQANYRTETYNIYNDQGDLVETRDVDNSIRAVLGEDNDGNDKITVEGFDYANLWCGPVKNEQGTVTGYNGYKVIIMIPIKMNPDAVGGPNVATNVAGSGIYTSSSATEPHVPFDSPTISLPVNVYLQKIGLQPGESAKFMIERAILPDMTGWTEAQIANWDPSSLTDWSYVSTVFVTNNTDDPEAEPIVKIKGMPATVTQDLNNDGEPDKDSDGNIIQLGVVYRVTEENWSWSYTILNTEEFPNPQYTVTSKVDNPFKFKNEKKANIEFDVRHAESKATNVFTGSGSVEYIDSKQR